MVVRLHAGKSFEAFLLLSRRHFKAKYKDGMNALDVKCGMGFFSFPIARFVSKTGKVLCVDLQEKMIKGLIRRAKKAGLSDRIDASVSQKNSLMLNNVAVKIDFALAFALVYEVPDKERLLSEIRNTMKESGKRLITEPKAHVSKADFDRTISIARSVGLEVITEVAIRRSYAILMAKKQD